MSVQSRKDANALLSTSRNNTGKGLSLLSFLFLLTACPPPVLDIGTAEGRAAIMDATNIALSNSKCDDAIELIEPLYNSSYTNNDVRMLRSSAHGCKVGINFFEMVQDLTTTNLVGRFFFRAMAEFFPSRLTLDTRLESGYYALDA